MNTGSYRLADEMDGNPLPLYSGRALRICTFFLSPVGIIMALVNASRSRRPDLRNKVLFASAVYLLAYAALTVVFLNWLPPDNTRRTLRILRFAISYALGTYFQNIFEPVLEAHLEAGGRLASAWLPALIIIGAVLAFLFTLLIFGGRS